MALLETEIASIVKVSAEDREKQTRIRKATSCLIVNEQALSSLLLSVLHVYVEGDYIAWTDGRTINYGNKWFDLSPEEKLFVILHETMHVALRHTRVAELLKWREGFSMELLNVAADLIINEGITYHANQGNSSLYKCPPNAVTIESLYNEGILKGDERDTVLKMSLPLLYDFLYERFKEQDRIVQVPSMLGEMADLKEGDSLPSSKAEKSQLESEGKLSTPEVEDQFWRDKLAGCNAANIVKHLANHCKAQVDWRKQLRSILNTQVSTKLSPSYARPSRRMAAQVPNLRDGQGLIYLPRFMPELTAGVVGVGLDLSGSVFFSTGLVEKFVAEISAMQQRTHCTLEFVTFDHEVNSHQTLPYDESKTFYQKVMSGLVELGGGGGTSFKPCLLKLNDLRCKVVVMLTDLYGEAGSARDYRNIKTTIWCTNTDEATPFGKRVQIH